MTHPKDFRVHPNDQHESEAAFGFSIHKDHLSISATVFETLAKMHGVDPSYGDELIEIICQPSYDTYLSTKNTSLDEEELSERKEQVAKIVQEQLPELWASVLELKG